MRDIKVGLFLSVAEWSEGGRWQYFRSMARHAEEVGLDSIWEADHLLVPQSSQDVTALARWECWSILAALAAVT